MYLIYANDVAAAAATAADDDDDGCGVGNENVALGGSFRLDGKLCAAEWLYCAVLCGVMRWL